jgi:hypothetical protein
MRPCKVCKLNLASHTVTELERCAAEVDRLRLEQEAVAAHDAYRRDLERKLCI